MTELNPLAGAVLGSTAAQRRLELLKAGQVRRKQNLRKDAAPDSGDTFEHQVESAEELPPANDQPGGQGRRPRQQPGKRRPDDDAPSLDVKA